MSFGFPVKIILICFSFLLIGPADSTQRIKGLGRIKFVSNSIVHIIFFGLFSGDRAWTIL